MNINITQMTLQDFNQISDILISDFDDFWTPRCLEQELKCKNSYFLVARADDKIVGFAGFKQVLDEADIMNIVVHKQFRSQGIGYSLLESLISSAKNAQISSISLEVNCNNLSAISLYHKLRFCGLWY